MAKATSEVTTSEQPPATPETPVTPAAQSTNDAAFTIRKPAEQVLIEHQFTPPTKLPNDATPAETGDQGKQGKVMTQAEIDAIITSRLEAERKKFADYDALKAKVKEFEDSQKTEDQKRAEQLQELQTANQRLTQQAQEAMRMAAITAAAANAGLDPEAAVKLVDHTAIKTDEAGNVTNAAELVKAVVDKYPGMVRRGAPTINAVNPSRTAEPAGRTDADRTREYFGGGGGNFWQGQGVRWPQELQEQ